MDFCSTKNKDLRTDFKSAITHPIPGDGGVFIPVSPRDLRRWIMHVDGNTTFSSIMGTLLSSFINDEYSPVICETIAQKAFKKFAPEITRLDKNLYVLELFHGPTLTHRDFGVSFLTSALDTIFCLEGGRATFLDVSTGEMGRSLAFALRGKQNLRAIVLYPAGSVRGLNEADLLYKGGNLLPIEVEGTAKDCFTLSASVTNDIAFSHKNNLTTASSVNIGRLLPQAAFYTFAFSRIKSDLDGDIFYALDSGNFGNVVALLYAWSFALPLNALILPTSSIIDLKLPQNSDDPSYNYNLERLKAIFDANPLMIKHFINTHAVNTAEIAKAKKTLKATYNFVADTESAKAFSAYQKHKALCLDDFATTVLVAKDYALRTPCPPVKLPSKQKPIPTGAEGEKALRAIIEQVW